VQAHLNMHDDGSSQGSSLADLAVLGKLFEEHRGRLLAMLQRRIDPALAVRIDAEDVLSEAFLEAGRKWRRFMEESTMTPYAWLYGIARDRLIEAWRRETRDRRDLRVDMPLPVESSAQLVMGVVHPGAGPSTAAARAEEQQQVQTVLGMLKEDDREILWMRQFEQLSYAEAGEVLGITENAATVRYTRALRRLKDLWQQLHPGSC
jgi:RNA polymerase sigma-70 factor (ECF subfamily)